MNGTLRWSRLTSSQRELAFNILFGSSMVYAYHGYSVRHPVLAESGLRSGSWRDKSTVVTHNATFVDRSGKDAESREGNVSQNTFTKLVSSPQPPPPQTKGDPAFEQNGNADYRESPGLQTFTKRMSSLGETLAAFDVAGLSSRIASMILPSWVRMLPGWLDKLQNELSMAPWSLSWEIWEEAHDPSIHPEIIWDAQVRLGNDLCSEEQTFRQRRRPQTAKALAHYLDVSERDVHPDDVPVIAMCASGGGLRALVAGASSFLSTHEDGLFDCVTYTAGVSGSCWLQTLYYSTIGRQDHGHIISHLKQRIGVHMAYPPALLGLLSQAPTNKFLLSGWVEKFKGIPDADFGLVDIYGLAIAARLLVPKGELSVSDWDLKVSNQRLYTDDGRQPLPIYTAVRHEVPAPIGDLTNISEAARFNAKHYDWFQWFEWTPYEFSCEELEAGIPTWAVGRRWQAGQTQWRQNGFALPELRVPLYMGIWGSAFCATLSHYYKEISPILKACGMGSVNSLLKDEDLIKVHPIDPAVIPNFVLGLRDRLPATCPESIHQSQHLQLMDAGIANNLPIYPLLRPGREVDVIVAFDASADVKGDNWIKVVDGYARQRGIRGWPMGAGWPSPVKSVEETAAELDETQAAAVKTVKEEEGASPKYLNPEGSELSYCNIWIGSTAESDEYMDERAPNRIEAQNGNYAHLTSSDAGIALVYFPFLANPKVPAVDPLKAEFMSTWNFVYTPDEIDQVVSLAKANFEEGKEQTRRTIRAIWERKRDARVKREKDAQDYVRRSRMRRGTAAMRRNGDVGQGDQFT